MLKLRTVFYHGLYDHLGDGYNKEDSYVLVGNKEAIESLIEQLIKMTTLLLQISFSLN